VDIPAVSMPIALSLKTWDICGIVLCDKTAHLRVAFYCPQHKVHLCNDHVMVNFFICHTCQVDGLSLERRNAHYQGCKLICAQNLREISILCIWKMSGIFCFSSWNMDQHFTCCVYIFVQCR
jgi:hypothetical protein